MRLRRLFSNLRLTTKKPLNPAYPKELKTIGDHIRKRRLDLNLFQKDVAEMIGVTEDAITYWENGRSNPRIKYYPKIIAFLGYDPEYREEDTLASKILNYRRANGLSRKEFAKMMGVHETTVMDWENGTEVRLIKAKEMLIEIVEK